MFNRKCYRPKCGRMFQAARPNTKFCPECGANRRTCSFCERQFFPMDGPCPRCSSDDSWAARYSPEEAAAIEKRIRRSELVVALALEAR